MRTKPISLYLLIAAAIACGVVSSSGLIYGW